MKKEYEGYLNLSLTIIFFSTLEAVNKTLVGRMNPFQINFLRFFIGGVLLFVFLLMKEDIHISKRDLAWVTLLGLINVVISMNMLQLSVFVKDAKASVVAVIASSNPIFVTIFAAIIEKEKIKIYKIVGLVIGLFGIVIVFFDKLKFGDLSLASPLLALMAAATFGLYTVLGRGISQRIGSLKMNAYSFMIGSLILVPFLIVFKIPVFKFDFSYSVQVLYLGLFVTGVAYLVYFKGLEIVGSSNGSLVFFIKPVLASIIAIVFLKENLSINLFVGTTFILLGIVIILQWDKIKTKVGIKGNVSE